CSFWLKSQTQLNPNPFMDSARPACSPQPEVRPLPCQQDLLLELMCKLQYKILEETHLSMPLQTPTCCRRRESMGKTEEKGCCSYRRQEFRQDFDLPEGLNIEDVTCYLDPVLSESFKCCLVNSNWAVMPITVAGLHPPHH
uniref:Uncharacterized protein n=1 Tax=Amphilophus citrinellus TaxID=61819 RepID=A0A3Q0S976_AMPCI